MPRRRLVLVLGCPLLPCKIDLIMLVQICKIVLSMAGTLHFLTLAHLTCTQGVTNDYRLDMRLVELALENNIHLIL